MVNVATTRPSYRFDGLVAVVTGAAGDLGGTVTRTLAEAGATVIAVDLSADGIDALTRDCRASRGRVVPVVADVTDECDVDHFAELARSHGEIALFFNNAGIEGRVARITDLDIDEFRRVHDVNVVGMVLGLRAVLPRMRAGGSIVNTASMAALRGSATMASYVASKHAVLGLTRTAALEAAERGVRVNAVCPGPIEGRMMSSLDGQRLELEQVDFHAGRTYAQLSEVADLVMFLLSDGSRLLTGQALEAAR